MMRFYFFNFVLKVGIGRLMEACFINQIEKDLQRKFIYYKWRNVFKVVRV